MALVDPSRLMINMLTVEDSIITSIKCSNTYASRIKVYHRTCLLFFCSKFFVSFFVTVRCSRVFWQSGTRAALPRYPQINPAPR